MVIILGEVSHLTFIACTGFLTASFLVYILIGLVGTLLALPVAPFSPKLHRGLTLLALATFAISTAYLWLVFPFSRADPFKVGFQQTVSIDPEDVFLKGASSYNASLNVPVTYRPKVVTELTAASFYMDDVLQYLPSARDKLITCGASEVRPGLKVCSWESRELSPSPGGRPLSPWTGDSGATFFAADVKRTGPASARISVQGRNTRNCRLYFDGSDEKPGNVKVTRYTVKGGKEGMQSGYPVDKEQGLKELRLWSRTWDREWEVDVDFVTPRRIDSAEVEDGKLRGRIACEWAEYESGMVDNGSLDAADKSKIPALEEALSFLPEWVAVTKSGDGLVEASVPFAV